MASKAITIKLDVNSDEILESIRQAIAASDWQKWLLHEAALLIGKPGDGGNHGCNTVAWLEARKEWVEKFNAHITD